MLKLSTHGLGGTQALHFLPGNRLLGRGRSGCAIWNLLTSKRTTVMKGYTWSSCVSPNGDYVFLSSYDAPVKCYSTSTLELVQELRESEQLSCLCVTPDGTHLVGCSRGDWCWWEAKAWSKVDAPFPTPNSEGAGSPQVKHYQLAFSPCGQWAITYGYGLIRVMKLQTGEVHDIPMPSAFINSVTFKPGVDEILCYNYSEQRVLELKTGKLITSLTIPTKNILTAFQFTPDGKYLLAADNDSCVHVVDALNWVPLHKLEWPVEQLRSLAISPDGLTAAAGGSSAKFVVWDLDF